jgi:signal transduction histidine kinase
VTSMFRKILVVYISVIILAFSVLTFTLHFKIKHFLASQRLQVLNEEARDLLPVLESVNSKAAKYPDYNHIVSRYKRLDNVSVNLLLVKSNNLGKIQTFTNQLISHNDILNVAAVKRVLSGQVVQVIGPFSKTIRESTLIVGVPIRNNGEVVGALFLHTPVQELQMGQITQIIMVVAAPILILSIIILYFISHHFSRPLLHMSRAVQSIGEGNFSERVEVNSEDEVGHLAQTFNQMAVQLQRLEIMRKDLIANVSHEIRTPLTSVRGFIQGILEGVIPQADQRQYLETSYNELQRLGTILNTMLDLSAIETGRIAIHPTSVRFAAIVDSVIERVQIRAEEKGIALHAFMPDKSIMLWGDTERLTQVLFNLVDNAIRHTSSGEISITSIAANGQLKVQIRDTGEGIPPKVLPHIWERFFTGSASRTSKQSRSGLGLTITKHLVELMNGHIDVESIPSKGTTFTLLFPIFSTSSS